MLKQERERLSKEDVSEDEVALRLSKYEESIERIRREVTEWYSQIVEGEYFFKGESSYLLVITPTPYTKRYERYIHNGKDTIVAEEIVIDRDGKEVWLLDAEVGPGTLHSFSMLQGPLYELFRILPLLATEGWELSNIRSKGNDTVYELQKLAHPRWSHGFKTISEKGYFIGEYWEKRTRDKSTSFTLCRFEEPQWYVSAQMYLPREIITERYLHDVYGHDGLVRRETVTLKEIKLNIDIPEETFIVPFTEGLSVTDYRFKPPKRYAHKAFEGFDEFIRRIDEEAAALKK